MRLDEGEELVRVSRKDTLFTCHCLLPLNSIVRDLFQLNLGVGSFFQMHRLALIFIRS